MNPNALLANLPPRRFVAPLAALLLSACAGGPAPGTATSSAPPVVSAAVPPPPPLAAPVTARERSTREITVKSELAYLVTLPRGYVDASVTGAPRWPLVLFLHGMGERGSDLTMVARHGPPKLIAAGREFPAIVVSPQCPLQPQFGWSTTAVVALLDDVCERYAVDASRIYLTGLSMGGYGTWAIACEQPHRFAAIAPICGGGDPAKAAALVGLPTWVFHGGADPVVPLAQSESMVKAIEAAGGAPKFTVYEGVGHDSWSAAYDDEQLWNWLFEQRRQPGR